MLVTKMFPLRKGACRSERNEIAQLRAWKAQKLRDEVRVKGAGILDKYDSSTAK